MVCEEIVYLLYPSRWSHRGQARSLGSSEAKISPTVLPIERRTLSELPCLREHYAFMEDRRYTICVRVCACQSSVWRKCVFARREERAIGWPELTRRHVTLTRKAYSV